MSSTQHSNSMELPPIRKDILVSLPAEIRLEILKYLGISQLLSSRRVCRLWNEILSSYKELWIKLCTLNGIVYTEREIIENPDKYRIFFLRMKSRVQNIKLGQCFYMESVPPRLESNFFQCDMIAFHCHEFKICVATEDSLIHIFDLNRMPMRILQINLSDFVSQPCSILNLRLDDTNAAVLEKTGVISIWDASDGHFVKSYGITEDVFCFDLLKGTLIVACGLRGCVVIIDLDTTEDFVVFISDDEASLEVVLARHWSEKPESQPETLLLFCMDKLMVSVHQIKICNSTDASERGFPTCLHEFKLHFNPLCRQFVYPTAPSLCYDGSKYLYFPLAFPCEHASIIYQLNLPERKAKEVTTNFPLHQLIGAGKMNFVFTSAYKNSQPVLLHAIDVSTFQYRFTCPLTSEVGVETNCYYRSGHFKKMGGRIACIGETSWLNGLNGFNDVGFICVYRNAYNSLKLVRWCEDSSDP